MLLKEPVKLFDGFVKLFSWQTVVLYWIHMSIINIQGTIGCLFQDGVVVDDEGIVQIAAYYMPQSRRLIHHHSAHRIIGRVVLYAQMILHQCRNHIIMSGAMRKLLRLCARNMPDHRHANLGFGEVAVMSPVIMMVLIELLTVVARKNDDGVIHQSLLLQGLEDAAQQQVVLIAAVAIHIPERSRIHIVAEFGIVGIRPSRLETLVLVGRKSKAMRQVEEQE